MNWNDYFLEIAEVVAAKSKDPHTKIGAVIVGPERQIVSTGFNGFPRKIAEVDWRLERPIKYNFMVHAEMNAIYNAARHGIPLRGCHMFVTGLAPCSKCAMGIIQSGIESVLGAAPAPGPSGKWEEDAIFAQDLFLEAGIRLGGIQSHPQTPYVPLFGAHDIAHSPDALRRLQDVGPSKQPENSTL